MPPCSAAASTPSARFEIGDKPAYTLNADLQKLSPAAVGQLLGLRSTGTAFDAGGKIELAGFTAQDLAASAKGSLHFDWRHGSLAPAHGSNPVPCRPRPFRPLDRPTPPSPTAKSAIKQDLVQTGHRKHAIEATIPLAAPLKVEFAKEPPPKTLTPIPATIEVCLYPSRLPRLPTQSRSSARAFSSTWTASSSLPWDSVERCWTRWALMRGLDPAYACEVSHGCRAIDSMAILRPDLDAAG